MVGIEEIENLAYSQHSMEDILNTEDVSIDLPTIHHQHSMPLQFGETEHSNAMTQTETENDEFWTRNYFLNASDSIIPDIGRNMSQVLNERLEEGNREPPMWLYFEVPENSNVYLDEKCYVCYNKYNEQNKEPRILPCGHVICNECLNTLASENQFTSMKCPIDRRVFRLTREQRTGI